jgi:hypothetical protein
MGNGVIAVWAIIVGGARSFKSVRVGRNAVKYIAVTEVSGLHPFRWIRESTARARLAAESDGAAVLAETKMT